MSLDKSSIARHSTAEQDTSSLRAWGARIALIVFGSVLGLALAWLLLPLVLSRFGIYQGTIARTADLDMGVVQYRVGNGDIFFAQRGSIRPPENPDQVLSTHRLAWDADGFRILGVARDTYDVVALGDSYTEATNVAAPWTRVLATETGLTVRNLGYRGYGPQESVRVMTEHGVQYDPDIVILGFFSGNDVSNAGTYDDRREDNFSLPAVTQGGISWSLDFVQGLRPRESYPYPVTLNLASGSEPIAFFNPYITALTLTADDLRQSTNYRRLRQGWQQLQQTSPSACVVIAYFPSKPEIYLPYVDPAAYERMYNNPRRFSLATANTELQIVEDDAVTIPSILASPHETRDVIQQSADEMGIQFIDLVPAFEQAAADGELLYYRYDTHPNQRGHDLAGRVIAEQLESGLCD